MKGRNNTTQEFGNEQKKKNYTVFEKNRKK